MHVEGGLEREVLDDHRRHVDESHGRMLGVEVAATDPAPFAVAQDGCVVRSRVSIERRDVPRAPGDLHGIGGPEGEGADGARRPVPAGVAVAIGHGLGLAAQAELDGATKTAALVSV